MFCAKRRQSGGARRPRNPGRWPVPHRADIPRERVGLAVARRVEVGHCEATVHGQSHAHGNTASPHQLGEVHGFRTGAGLLKVVLVTFLVPMLHDVFGRLRFPHLGGLHRATKTLALQAVYSVHCAMECSTGLRATLRLPPRGVKATVAPNQRRHPMSRPVGVDRLQRGLDPRTRWSSHVEPARHRPGVPALARRSAFAALREAAAVLSPHLASRRLAACAAEARVRPHGQHHCLRHDRGQPTQSEWQHRKRGPTVRHVVAGAAT
mmetsp:Transcript_67636/g.195807  ORF Transcript_67636/g.195807 Transcript_67636/m.195807 type:complete len:265 (-) Transcript_67636:3-797(-)